MSSEIVLDIGGTKFKTSKMTLTSPVGSEHGHFFNRMFGGDWDIKSNEDGSIWIDRDPTHFSVILNYLRSGDNVQLPDCIRDLNELNAEAEFYGLKGLHDIINTKLMCLQRSEMFSNTITTLKRCLMKANLVHQFYLTYRPERDTRWDSAEFHQFVRELSVSIGFLECISINNFAFSAKDFEQFSQTIKAMCRFRFYSDCLPQDFSQAICFQDMKDDKELSLSFILERKEVVGHIFQIKTELMSLSSYWKTYVTKKSLHSETTI